jgi:hypothetical protein
MRCSLALNDGAQPSFLLLPTAFPMNLRQCLGIGLVSLLSGLAMPASAEDYQIKITKMRDLNFGSMLVISSGTVILDPKTGHFSGEASVIRPASLQKNTDATGPAKFLLTCSKKGHGQGKGKGKGQGQGNHDGELEYSLKLDDKPDDVSLSGRNSSRMELRNYQMYSSLGLSTEKIEDDRKIKVRECSAYRETIYVGATLRVGNSQQPGHYTNDDLRLEVSFDYDD